MDADQARLEQEIAALTERINASAEEIAQQEASQHALTERGYELDREGQEAQNQANEAAVELERATARERSNTERVSELEARIAAAGAELEQTRTQLAGIEEERAQQRSFLGDGGRRGARVPAEGGGAAAGSAHRGRRGIYCGAGAGSRRRHAMHLLTLAGNARNYIAQGEESLAALEREAERLEGEMGQARIEQENLGVQSGQSRLRFESADATPEAAGERDCDAARDAADASAATKTRGAPRPTNCAANRQRWQGGATR